MTSINIVSKTSSDAVYLPKVPSLPSKSSTDKTADEIIQDIRNRYGIQTKLYRSTDTIDSLIHNSIGSSYMVAKPDYKGEDTKIPFREYGKKDPNVCIKKSVPVIETEREKGVDEWTQTDCIKAESIASQAQTMQLSVGLQTSLLVKPSINQSTNSSVSQSVQETQTDQEVVLLQDLEEIVSFMDDIVHQVICEKESKEIQTVDYLNISEYTQTIHAESLDLGVQTISNQVNNSYSQTQATVLSDVGIQKSFKGNDSCLQTDCMEKADVGTFTDIETVISDDDATECMQYTEEDEKIFKQDFILTFLQEKLQEFKLELQRLE